MISYMIKRLIIALFIFCNFVSYAQNTEYYKLTRIQKNNVPNRNVSGGQFITFFNSICFESDSKGDGVGHGYLDFSKANSNSQFSIYQGSSYWGKSTTFKFNADKSVLNVVLDNGDIYVYKRAAAPANQETCSLIRKPSSGGNTGGAVVGGITPPPVYPVEPYNPTPIQPDNSNTGTTKQKPRYEWHEVTEDCYMCHGSGKCSSCNGTHSIWYQFGGGKIECPNCRPDGRCTTCGGRGKITKQKLY